MLLSFYLWRQYNQLVVISRNIFYAGPKTNENMSSKEFPLT